MFKNCLNAHPVQGGPISKNCLNVIQYREVPYLCLALDVIL